MQRLNSMSSVGSVSSQCGIKKTKPTHMLIRRDFNNDILLLPITNLVNGSAAKIKANDVATFKVDMNNRKQERGTVIFFGFEEECQNQLDILQMCMNNKENTSVTGSQASSKQTEVHRIPGSNSTILIERCSNKDMSKGSLNKNAKGPDSFTKSQRNRNSHKNNSINHIDNQERSSELKRTESITSSDSNESITNRSQFNATQKLYQNVRTNSLFNKKQKNNEPENGQSNGKNGTLMVKTPPNVTPQASRPLTHSASTKQNQSPNLMNSVMSLNDDFLLKKCKRLTRENQLLQSQYERLKKEVEHLKKTTIPMPDANSRAWFIKIGEIFSNKPSEIDVYKYATELGIDDPNELLGCVQDTASSTARKIIRLLYSPFELATMKGTQVPVTKRLSIKKFCEHYCAPVSNRKFNEAVNGVFRSQKYCRDVNLQGASTGSTKTTGNDHLNKEHDHHSVDESSLCVDDIQCNRGSNAESSDQSDEF